MHSFAYTDINTRFYFDTDIDTLNADQQSQLENFIENTLYQKQYKELYVIGYTDADGTNLYNMDLSNRRALNVTEMLVQKGIPDAMIDRSYQGETHPVATNNSEAGKSLNRRVEIILRLFDINKAADIIHEIKGNPEQKFVIDNSKQAIVQGEKGIRIIFPPNCFQSADNTTIDPKNITVELEEVRTVQDAIFSGVLSETNTLRPLETGGMFKIKVTANGKALTMKPNMQYTVQLDNKNPKNDMTVFTPAPNKNGLVAWAATKEPFKRDSSLNCERPSIKLDKNIIKAWQLHPQHEGVLDYYTFRLPQAPIRPAGYRRPREPKEPQEKDYVYQMPWFKRVFMTKAAEEKKRLEMYNKLHDIFEKQHAKYEANLVKYIKDSTDITDQIEKYNTDIRLYEEEMKKVAKGLQEYKTALRENALVNSFDNVKSMLIYKSDNNLLRTHDLYVDINHYLWQLAAYNKYNSGYIDRFTYYRDKLYKAYKENFPDNYLSKLSSAGFYGYDLGNYYDGLYTDLLRADKTVEKHLGDAIDKYMQAEVSSGIFDPNNFTTYYQASLNKFDWVNCDRFYSEDKNNMITVSVPNYNVMDKNLYAIVKEMNSNISIPLIGNMHQVSLPKNKEVIIVAIGLDKNYTPQFAQKKFTTEKNIKVELSFRSAKISEIRNEISNI